MAQRLPSLYQQHANSASALYAGGSLSFYASLTSTPLATYSDAGLTVANTIVATDAHLTLNSAGRPSVDVFLQNVAYKVILRDASGNTIWVADPVSSSDFASFPITKLYAGNPNGFVAGTAGSAGVLPTMCWDFTNSVLYFCTATGVAAAAIWTAINASSATTTPILTPQGRLTLTSATPVMTAETVAATSVFYTPCNGNLIPIYNGSAFVNSVFTEALTTLALSASHALNTIYDVFVFLNSGVVTIGTGPAWNSSAAGSGSRGASADLARLNGILTNAQSITARNGATTYTVAGNYGTYVGSIFIDGTAGQITCHNTFGQSRKWGVWNAYNREPIVLQAGDSTASWAYNVATIRASNAASANSLTAFTGLAEEVVRIVFSQDTTMVENTNAASPPTSQIGIGVNSTTVFSGKAATFGNSAAASASRGAHSNDAHHVLGPDLGIDTVTSLEKGNATATIVTTFVGTSASMILRAEWRG